MNDYLIPISIGVGFLTICAMIVAIYIDGTARIEQKKEVLLAKR